MTDTPERCKGRELAQRVADAMEQANRNEGVLANLGFNMQDWVSEWREDYSKRARTGEHTCGTTACIAGWTKQVLNLEERPLKQGQHYRPTWIEGGAGDMADALGLTRSEREVLFSPPEGRIATDEDAIAVLRHYGNTGQVSWNRGRLPNNPNRLG